tara:strand:+ start:621 stop:902 length:282 start_codon:yes stop_codon:yes gene_type:complete
MVNVKIEFNIEAAIKAWAVIGIIWFIAFSTTVFYPSNEFSALLIVIVLFLSIIVAIISAIIIIYGILKRSNILDNIFKKDNTKKTKKTTQKEK